MGRIVRHYVSRHSFSEASFLHISGNPEGAFRFPLEGIFCAINGNSDFLLRKCPEDKEEIQTSKWNFIKTNSFPFEGIFRMRKI